jgi:hypothetical protein
MQIQFGREWKSSKADGGPPLICQGHRWQISPPPRCYQRVDSCNNNSVAADQSNLCGQRTSINANNAKDTEDAAKDADNARRYADNAAKAKAEADKEVGGGDAEVLD